MLKLLPPFFVLLSTSIAQLAVDGKLDSPKSGSERDAAGRRESVWTEPENAGTA